MYIRMGYLLVIGSPRSTCSQKLFTEQILEDLLYFYTIQTLVCLLHVLYNSFFVLFDLLTLTSWQFIKLLINFLTPTTFSLQIIANCCF